MDSYISSELIAKLRQEQRFLRRSVRELESAAREGNMQQLGQKLRELSTVYASHDRLVGALLEAVEPDEPIADACD
jgi:hypothetical protein